MHAITWNVGGLAPDAILLLLQDLQRERIHPFNQTFVVLLQEVIIDVGKHEAENGNVQLLSGKQTGDWRGTGIAHTNNLVRSRPKLLQCGTCCRLTATGTPFLAMSGHLPHHATLAETGEILASWHEQLSACPRRVLGWDANETFTATRGGNISFPTQGEAKWRSNGWPSWTSSFHLRTLPSRPSTPTIESSVHDDLTIYACGG